MAIKVAIIYYSATGTTYQLARAVEQGASEAGAEVRFRKVRELAPAEAIASNQGWATHKLESQHVVEATNDDLVWADAILFGTPTRYGLPTAQLKQFLDTTGKLWAQGALVNKICSSFTSSATAHGGQETTIVNLNTTFYHWGAIIVGPVTPIPSSSKPGIHTAHHLRATTAPLNQTRPHSHQPAFGAAASRSWLPNLSLDVRLRSRRWKSTAIAPIPQKSHRKFLRCRDAVHLSETAYWTLVTISASTVLDPE